MQAFQRLPDNLLRRSCCAPSRTIPVHRQYVSYSRKTTHAFAQQLTTVHSAATGLREDEGKGKAAVPVQVSRPSLPCEKPLPLANVMEVQRLLFLLEAPEYCMRAFREHGVNGQDLLHMQPEDLEDSRFKFPRNVQRKVFRIAEAWRAFQRLAGGPTHCSISRESFLDHHRSRGRSADEVSQLELAFQVLDVNNNGAISFEDFLVGFSLVEAADLIAAESVQFPEETADPTSGSVSASGAAAASSGSEASSGAALPVDRAAGAGSAAGGGAAPPTGFTTTTGGVGDAPLSAVLAAPGGSGEGLFSSLANWFRL